MPDPEKWCLPQIQSGPAQIFISGSVTTPRCPGRQGPLFQHDRMGRGQRLGVAGHRQSADAAQAEADPAALGKGPPWAARTARPTAP